jgi:hypothetical protein
MKINICKGLILLLAINLTSSAWAEDSKLTVGGELRERFEYYSNYLWGSPLSKGDGYYLHRIMGHVDYKANNQWRFFLQLKSNTVSDKTLPARPIDKDELDLHQAYFEWNFSDWKMKGGRQELSYGSGRLVSVREGPNVRQSFDAFKMSYSASNVVVDAFASRPVETNPWSFDDGSDYTREFFGLYSTWAQKLDIYYFLLERKDAAYHAGTAQENRSSLGTRFFSDKNSSFDYDWEAVWQYGNFGTSDINAWTVATNTGYSLKKTKWKPRFGLKANIASGDSSKSDHTLNTFNALFPKGAYFNEAAIIGPANIIDLHPSFAISPDENLTFQIDWDFMWRQSLNDGLYNISLNPTVKSGNSDKRTIGSQLALSGEWKITGQLLVFAQYMHFFTGSYIEAQTPGKDIDFYTMWVSFKF